MGFFTTHLLILTQHVDFSINIKQALEKIGGYEVTPFSSVENALEHLRDHQQDIILLDFTISTASGVEIVEQVREIQPNIGIIIGPDTPENRWYAPDLNVGLVDIPCTVRALLPHLRAIEPELRDHLPDTAESPIPESQPDTSKIQAQPTPKRTPTVQEPLAEDSGPLEFVVSEEDNSLVRVNRRGDSQPQLKQESQKAIEIFEKLASEEPPMPSFEDSGTVHDLVVGVSEANLEKVIESFSESFELQDVTEDASKDESLDEIPATLILEVATDDSTPLEAFSLTEFLKSIGQSGIQPLPSWVRESRPYVEEPDFLPEGFTGFSQIIEYTSSITHPSDEQAIENDPENLPTDHITPQVRSRPAEDADFSKPESLPEESDIHDSGRLSSETAEQDEDEPDLSANEVPETVMPAMPPETLPEMLVKEKPADESNATQLALILTQVSLETTAEATLLAKAGKIVAVAGKLSAEDTESISAVIADDWEASPEKSRIRFINLPSTGADYMLYSKYTDSDLTLSLVFAGTMPLRVIRRQGKRLADALQSVPEMFEEPDATEGGEPDIPQLDSLSEPVSDNLTYMSFSAVWLLNDTAQQLSALTAQVLADDLYDILASQSWRIQKLEVHKDHIYLQAEFPGEALPNEVVRDVMKQSAAIVAREGGTEQPAKLWSDSYLVVTPGREMSADEIREFSDFVRT